MNYNATPNDCEIYDKGVLGKCKAKKSRYLVAFSMYAVFFQYYLEQRQKVIARGSVENNST